MKNSMGQDRAEPTGSAETSRRRTGPDTLAVIVAVVTVGVAIGALTMTGFKHVRDDMHRHFSDIDRRFSDIDRRFSETREDIRELRRDVNTLREAVGALNERTGGTDTTPRPS